MHCSLFPILFHFLKTLDVCIFVCISLNQSSSLFVVVINTHFSISQLIIATLFNREFLLLLHTHCSSVLVAPLPTLFTVVLHFRNTLVLCSQYTSQNLLGSPWFLIKTMSSVSIRTGWPLSTKVQAACTCGLKIRSNYLSNTMVTTSLRGI